MWPPMQLGRGGRYKGVAGAVSQHAGTLGEGEAAGALLFADLDARFANEGEALTLADPMCGAGTLPVEAALLASEVARSWRVFQCAKAVRSFSAVRENVVVCWHCPRLPTLACAVSRSWGAASAARSRRGCSGYCTRGSSHGRHAARVSVWISVVCTDFSNRCSRLKVLCITTESQTQPSDA